MTKLGAAYLAAGFLTRRRVDHVAKEYIAWIEGKDDESRAIDALLAAAQLSKNPDLVMAQADAFFDDFADGSVDESHEPEESGPDETLDETPDETPDTPEEPESPEQPDQGAPTGTLEAQGAPVEPAPEPASETTPAETTADPTAAPVDAPAAPAAPEGSDH